MIAAIAATLLALRLAGELLLARLNLLELSRHSEAPPPALAGLLDSTAYARSVAYSRAKLRFGMLTECVDTAIVAALLLSGVLPWLHNSFAAWAPDATWNQALFLICVALLMGIPALPFEWWSQFRIEQRFGFNNAGPALWLGDKVRDTTVGVLIGFPLLWLLLSLVAWVGSTWWIIAFGIVFAFQLAMIVLYPKLILPLYNKLSPLEDGELRTRLMALAERTGFQARSIEIIDGSKRSGHSNAYFSGFGRFRRIVLYDTLVQQLSAEELEAVLAHEIGHYRCGHVPRMIAMSAAMLFGVFALIAWLSSSAWFNPAFGFAPGLLAPSFLLVALLAGSASFWLTPLVNALSRRHEYEADAFAAKAMGSPAPLLAALRKLAGKNLTNLTPHPLYSGFHYSHPTLVERERALSA